ncbi:tetratricopeptide repeat protein [Xanthomarina sp. GH4-25]|uniref:type IX secretion system periplasmic lipoprotein PorW/SprE n=1 Tax=Xanthomarina sp. GH4-25 TaxID=3349335 RepID=UPI003877C7A5
MRTSFRIISFLFCVALFISSCSRKKDSFISRNYHALSAKDNTLYNGYIALEEGRIGLNESYQDNYWDILPVERMQVDDEVILPGQNKNESFSRAEEKAVKAIQMHSMNIQGKEVNPQMDEAYLLLGKSRYFDQRFVPALEAFNYILYKYAASDKINQAKIWREKTNLRLENDQLAIENLKRLLEQEELKDQDLADATSTLAQAYINLKSLDSAVTQLNIASLNTKNNDERGRYRYIQGQLYNRLGYKDSANIAFGQVIKLNRKTPRIYLIAAHLEQANNLSISEDNREIILETLTEIEENRENRPFLDKIYHQIGDYYRTIASDSLAVEYYNRSLRTNSADKKLKAINYEILGDYFFDYSEYKIAGAYFDSTMTNMVKDSKPFRIIKRKRDNLDDVIYYEDIAVVNDSILSLTALSYEDQLAYFENYTEQLKIQAEKEKEEEEIQERNKEFANNFANNDFEAKSAKSMTLSRGPNGPPGGSSFYFYNPTTVAYGKNDFIKNWGDRALEDDWRWSTKSKSFINKETLNTVAVAVAENELFNPEYYIDKIPTDQKKIDSIIKERNFAYYQLAVIYKEKFKEYELSKETFQHLLNQEPEEKLVLPSKYNLYKLYALLEENDEATIAKNDIIANYPDSRYAAILLNPEAGAAKDENSPENIYTKLFNKLENQEFSEVITQSDEYITAFEGDPMVPKFELLKATATGRLNGFDAYSNALNFVALNYANTPEGVRAQEIIDNVLPKLANKEFVDSETDDNYKVVYYFTNTTKEAIEAFKTALDKEIEKVNVYNLSISEDIYNPTTTFVIIHGLKSKDGALGYAESLEEKKKDKIKHDHFAVSSTNYRIIQIHKNFDEYLNIE